jgi:hypothetical protein
LRAQINLGYLRVVLEKKDTKCAIREIDIQINHADNIMSNVLKEGAVKRAGPSSQIDTIWLGCSACRCGTQERGGPPGSIAWSDRCAPVASGRIGPGKARPRQAGRPGPTERQPVHAARGVGQHDRPAQPAQLQRIFFFLLPFFFLFAVCLNGATK